jgi:hypothetical protein
MRRTIFSVTFLMLVSSFAGAQFLQQGAKLVATGTTGRVDQGLAVALSADGDTAIVGGPEDAGGRGAAWVFVRSGGEWKQQGKLVGADADGSYARQGEAVALSADGNTAIVGGPGDSDNLGAAWVFTRAGGVWTQQGGKLVGSGAAGGWTTQGAAVALSADGNTALVGGPWDSDSGATWVFTRSGGVWTQQGGKLVGTGGSGAAQGMAVALSGDGNTAAVGGPLDDHMGALWIFTRAGGEWAQLGEKLVPSGMKGTADLYDWLGIAISADGNTAMLGRPSDDGYRGAAWVFTRANDVWTQQGDKLVGAGAVGSSAYLGSSVSVSGDGDLALVGGYNDDLGAGATWVFARSGGAWRQQGEKLVGTGAIGRAYQGMGVALSADGRTAVVGGCQDNNGAGASWVFTRSGGVETTLWVPVVAHTAGVGVSQWRSDLGLLNAGTSTANVKLVFHGPDGPVSSTTYVPPGAQSLLVDVVAQLAASGQGALEIVSQQPLRVTSRTYNQEAADATCHPSGTSGQGYPALSASEGLSEWESAWLPHLTENAAYRTNIGLVNTGNAAAETTIELHDGAGAAVASYTVSLAPGEWKQETQPFKNRAGRSNVHCGYAKVTVDIGSGVVALASVVDNITNDPTTIPMQR